MAVQVSLGAFSLLKLFLQASNTMPELPEVETIRRDLFKVLPGRTILDVDILRPSVIKQPAAQNFQRQMANRTIEDVLRRGKLLVFPLSGQKFLTVHLRMTGALLYGRCGVCPRVVFKLDNGLPLSYEDRRCLGELRLVDDYRDLEFVRSLGKEPFDLKPREFVRLLGKKRSAIAAVLLDQRVIAGVGNIYAQEALFRSGIDPRRPADSLSGEEADKLLGYLVDILNRAITLRGSSVDTFVSSDGSEGAMAGEHQVYDREGKPCLHCGRPLRKERIGGRGTCFCENCQR